MAGWPRRWLRTDRAPGHTGRLPAGEYLGTPSTCHVQVTSRVLGKWWAMADSTTATPPGGRLKAVASVSESFIDLQRTVRRSKARLLAAAGNDVESATHLLLHTVESEGPMRASALAASAQADLSTVSRQVAALVSRGLLERRADQVDGRACLLA